MQSTKNLVSIVLIAKGDYATNIYSFENSGFKKSVKEEEFFVKDEEKKIINVVDDIEVELIVGIYSYTDTRLIEYFRPYIKEFCLLNDNANEATAYNELFRHCQGEFTCIYKPNIFLQRNWLHELVFYCQNIDKSGVVSIASSFLGCEYVPVMSVDHEKMVSVFIAENNVTDAAGVSLFYTQHLYFTGAFDESNDIEGYELMQFQLRAAKIGHNNFYVPSQTCIVLNKSDFFAKEKHEKVIASVEAMRKMRNFYIPLLK